MSGAPGRPGATRRSSEHRYSPRRHKSRRSRRSDRERRRRRRCGLYIHFHPGSNITHVEGRRCSCAPCSVSSAGPSSSSGRRQHFTSGPDVRARACPVSAVARRALPRLCPDLNPDEFVWTHFKATLANGRPDNLDELMVALCRITKKARKRTELLRSFITASELPAFCDA